jgi:hypothetical protein
MQGFRQFCYFPSLQPGRPCSEPEMDVPAGPHGDREREVLGAWGAALARTMTGPLMLQANSGRGVGG